MRWIRIKRINDFHSKEENYSIETFFGSNKKSALLALITMTDASHIA
jgi:hypothetical protein